MSPLPLLTMCKLPQIDSLDFIDSDRDKMDNLTELLNHYSLYGIPDINTCPSIKCRNIDHDSCSYEGHGTNVQLRNKSRTPSLQSKYRGHGQQSSLTLSSGFNTLSTDDRSSTISPNGSVRRKSYNPPPSQQQSMKAFQANRPGSYHEQPTGTSAVTGLAPSSAMTTPSASMSIEENIINIDPDDADLFIESDWSTLVQSQLDKHTIGQMDAFWELLTTEIFYIKRLRVIHNLFHVCLKNLQKEGLLVDVSIRSSRTFLFYANVCFDHSVCSRTRQCYSLSSSND